MNRENVGHLTQEERKRNREEAVVRYGEAENCPQPAPKAHKILPKGSQKREPKPCQKGVNIEALPEQTDSKKAEQNTNKTPTKNSIF